MKEKRQQAKISQTVSHTGYKLSEIVVNCEHAKAHTLLNILCDNLV